MNQARMFLQMCSPLQRIIQTNKAIGGSKKFYSGKRKSCPDKAKADVTVKCAKKEKVCKPCEYMETKSKVGVEPVEKLPGCMPFTENEPIKSTHGCVLPKGQKKKKHRPKRASKSSTPCGIASKGKNPCR